MGPDRNVGAELTLIFLIKIKVMRTLPPIKPIAPKILLFKKLLLKSCAIVLRKSLNVKFLIAQNIFNIKRLSSLKERQG